MGGKRRRHRTREEWTRIFHDQSASGLSRKAFCERHAITLSSFDNAKARLRGRAMVPSAEPAFLGVVVEDSPPVPREPGWDMELSLGGGVVLRLRRSLSP